MRAIAVECCPVKRKVLQILSIPVGYRWLITLAFIAVIVLLSVTPDRPQPGDTVFAWLITHTSTPVQKLLHVACYAAIALLWAWTLESIESRVLRLIIAFVLTVGIGATLEASQTRIPGRYGSITDVLLNALGAVLGLLAALLIL